MARVDTLPGGAEAAHGGAERQARQVRGVREGRPLSTSTTWCAGARGRCGAAGWSCRAHHHAVRGGKPTRRRGRPPYCHGPGHANRLHFRWVASDAVGGGFGRYGRMEGGEGGHIEYILLDEPTEYARALEMGGWRPLRRWRW